MAWDGKFPSKGAPSVRIVGNITVGSVVTASVPSGVTVAGYQWSRSTDGGKTFTDIAGATASTYTVLAADDGCKLRVTVSTIVTGTDQISPVYSAPTVVSPPVINGIPTVGNAINVTSAVFGGGPATVSTKILLDSSEILGAGLNYIPAASDVGHQLKVRQIAMNDGGTVSSDSVGVSVLTYLFSNQSASDFVSRSPVKISASASALYDGLFNDIGDIISSKMDAFYVFAAENREIAKLNLVGNQFNCTESYSTVTFAQNVGFSTSASPTGQLNTNLDMSSASLKLTMNDCSLGIGSKATGSSGSSMGNIGQGTNGGSRSYLALGTKTGVMATAARTSPVIARGSHGVVSRSDASGYSKYQNSALVEFVTIASSSSINGSVVILSSGAPANDTSTNIDQTTYAFIGRSLTATEISRIYYAMNKYLAALGVESLAARNLSISASASNSLNSGSTITYSIALDSVTSPITFSLNDLSTSGVHANSLATDLAAAAGKTTGITVSGTTVTVAANKTGTFNVTRSVSSTAAAGAVSGMRLITGVGSYSYGTTATVMQPGATPYTPPVVKGVNLSGMEFGGSATANPFVPPTSNVDYYKSRGFSCIRLPHNWSRLQNTLYGALNVVGDGTGAAEQYKSLVNYITNTAGMYCIVDPHDYGGRTGYTDKVGSTNLPLAALEDYLVKLVQYLGVTNSKIIVCLNNEPVGMTATQWASCAQSLVYTLRAAGFLGMIHVPGIAYTGAWSWVSSGNAAALAGLVDPLSNFAFEVHQYLDTDSSGTSSSCVVGGGSSKLSAFLNWLAADATRKGFLGEFAANPALDSQCGTELPALLSAANGSSQMKGWAAWGAGPYWTSSYIFRLEDPNSTSNNTAYMSKLIAGL